VSSESAHRRSKQTLYVGGISSTRIVIFQRPFVCPWCPRSFVNSANCRKHKLKDHPKEVEEYEAIHGKKGVSLAVKTLQPKA
jgi:hypothetical protein